MAIYVLSLNKQSVVGRNPLTQRRTWSTYSLPLLHRVTSASPAPESTVESTPKVHTVTDLYTLVSWKQQEMSRRILCSAGVFRWVWWWEGKV